MTVTTLVRIFEGGTYVAVGGSGLDLDDLSRLLDECPESRGDHIQELVLSQEVHTS